VRGESVKEKHSKLFKGPGFQTARHQEGKKVVFTKISKASESENEPPKDEGKKENHQIRNKFALLYRNMMEPEGGDMVKVMSKIKKQLKRQNISINDQSMLAMQKSESYPVFGDLNDSIIPSDLKVEERKASVDQPKQSNLDEELDKFFLT